MLFKQLLSLSLFATVALTGCSTPPSDPIRVMSFNIRYSAANDGENAWPKRRELLFKTIEVFNPDILGLQEVLDDQAEEIRARFPAYHYVGVGRDDGKKAGEAVPVLVRSSRFEVLDEGHIWLCETPDVPGIRGWDAALPRMVTWICLKTRERPDVELYVFNTHFDHVGERARLESARLIRKNVESLGNLPILVIGDFNSAPDSPAGATLRQRRGTESDLLDTYASVAVETLEVGTYHGFTGARLAARIDWILHTPRIETLSATIDHTAEDGRFPSDHFPVTATVRIIRTPGWYGD